MQLRVSVHFQSTGAYTGAPSVSTASDASDEILSSKKGEMAKAETVSLSPPVPEDEHVMDTELSLLVEIDSPTGLFDCCGARTRLTVADFLGCSRYSTILERKWRLLLAWGFVSLTFYTIMANRYEDDFPVWARAAVTAVGAWPIMCAW